MSRRAIAGQSSSVAARTSITPPVSSAAADGARRVTFAAMAEVTFAGATRSYTGLDHPAVDHLDLTIADGELLVLVGPSGCGKSTTLRMLAGLEPVDAGTIEIGGHDVTKVAPKDRDIAMVFQSYALYPHMTVADN